MVGGKPARTGIDKRPVAGQVAVGMLGLDGDQFGDLEHHGVKEGLPVSEAVIGETWRIGTAVVQVTGPRIPCVTFQSWMGDDHWVKRFAAAGRPGAYLRVLVPGTVSAGAAAQVLRRPGQHVTVAESMLAFYGDQDLLRRLLEVEGRGEKWDEIGRRVLRPAQV